MLTRCDKVSANRGIIVAWLLDSDDSAEDNHIAATLHWCLNEGAVSAADVRQQARDQYDSIRLFPGNRHEQQLCLNASEMLHRLADKLHAYPGEG